LKKGLYLGTK